MWMLGVDWFRVNFVIEVENVFIFFGDKLGGSFIWIKLEKIRCWMVFIKEKIFYYIYI